MTTHRSRRALLTILIAFIALISTSCQWIIRASVYDTGGQMSGKITELDVSNDGRFVIFGSEAPGGAGDTNGGSDVFLRDTTAGTTTMITNYDSYSHAAVISGDGSKVAFVSPASDIVANDDNGETDVFLYDTATGVTTMVSQAGGVEGNGPSSDVDINDTGSRIVFKSAASNLTPGDTNNKTDIFRSNGTTVSIVSVGINGAQSNGTSREPTIGGFGTVVAWTSDATNLVAGDTNGVGDVFSKDLASGATNRQSISPAGQANGSSGSPTLNRTGSRIAFSSQATNLVPDDTNGVGDVFLRVNGTIERVSISDAGDQFPFVTQSPSTNFVGTRIAMQTDARNVGGTAGNRTIVRDQASGHTDVVSRDTSGSTQGNTSGSPVMSADGRYVAFTSDTALVSDDTNSSSDVFLAAYPEPRVDSITPSAFPAGQSTTFTIDGSSFESPTLKNTAGVTYQVLGTTPTQITAQVTVDSTASTGDRSIRIINTGTGPGINTGSDHFCLNCITIN